MKSQLEAFDAALSRITDSRFNPPSVPDEEEIDPRDVDFEIEQMLRKDPLTPEEYLAILDPTDERQRLYNSLRHAVADGLRHDTIANVMQIGRLVLSVTRAALREEAEEKIRREE